MLMGRRAKNLPPGPSTLPILGNIHQIPITGLHAKFLQWGEQYGGIFSLKIASSTMIVLFDRKAVHDLVDKKGVIYSERPPNHVADIVTHGDSFAFMNNTPLYREQRKVASHNLSPRILDEKVGGIQDADRITTLLRDILTTPADFYHHVMRTTCSVACIMVWGQRGATYDSFFGRCVYDAMESYSEALEPGANPPVDDFPFLKYLPDFMSPWRTRAQRSYHAMDQTWKKARALSDARRDRVGSRNCIADKMLEDDKLTGKMSDQQINHFLGVLVEGGADTISSSILTMIHCLSKYPEHQRRAQKELDTVCGTSSLPLGVPHRVAKDDWYDGMLIPKDATVIIPSYAIHRSEQMKYKNPDTFDPSRYINHPRLASDYAGSLDFNNRDHYGYGAGRRICPGMHLAERTQWRAIAKILWAFDIELAVDPATGKKIVPDPEAFKEGIAHGPKPYKVVFKPRSQAHIDTILREAEQSLDEVAKWD
ncbi:hypothetical protein LB504_003034 [Fusarium proliferatum]|nr:hypothetical protein LB504_003034 [Fusarium proliferatum]